MQQTGLLNRITGSRFGKRYIGDKKFFAAVLAIIVPVIIQNSISNFVGLLDNIMVGAVGTEQMSGVSISNQLIFVFMLCVFGAMAGPGIFAAQYTGAGDDKGVRNCFRLSMYIAFMVSGIAIAVFALFKEQLLSLYINDVDGTGGAEETLSAGMEYMEVMLWGLLPFAVTTAYASILRVTGETKLPMIAAVTAVLINLVFNYMFIFGHFGFSEMKAKGAAIATVISRYLEMLIVVYISHRRLKKSGKYKFLDGAYADIRVPMKVVKNISAKGAPLLVNEFFWSLGVTVLAQQYSLRGLNVVAANTVASTISNLFNVLFLSMGTAASVMVGASLGANDAEGAKLNARRIIAFEIFICVTVGAVMFALAPLMPALFTETTADVRAIAASMIRVIACIMPINGFAHCSYFILRAGGKTFITLLFDAGYTWFIPVPLAFALVRLTGLEIIPIYLICNAAEIIKVILGYILLKKGIWINNIVAD